MRRAFALINQNCRSASRLVSDSIDRPLGPLERAGLAIHLAGCRSCRRYQTQLRTIDRLIESTADRAGDEVRLSERARERISARLQS